MKYVVRDKNSHPGGHNLMGEYRWLVVDQSSNLVINSAHSRSKAIEKRNELNAAVQPRQPKRGDKVKCYEHIHGHINDGSLGILESTSDVLGAGYKFKVKVFGDDPSAGSRWFKRVELVEDMTTGNPIQKDTSKRTPLQEWQEDVLVPAVLQAQDDHNLCDDGIDEFLDNLGLSRPTVDLPTNRGAIVQLTRGDYDGYEAIRTGDDYWVIIDDSGYANDTIEEGELQKMGPKV